MSAIRHFSGDLRVYHPTSMLNAEAATRFPGVQLVSADSFSVLVGFAQGTESREQLRFIGALPITRRIARPDAASNHKCDARCRGAKGHQCECSCGGRYHGIDA